MLTVLVLIGLVVWLLPQLAAGTFSPTTAAVAIIAVILLLNVAGKAARLAFRVGLPLLALAVLIIVSGGGEPRQMVALLVGLAPLALVLAALHVALGGFVRRTRRRR